MGSKSLDLLKLFGAIYLRVLKLQLQGFRKFFFKGSRGSGKTTTIVLFIIIEMVLDHQASAVVVMNKKVDHSKRTMREFDKWIVFLSKIWPNFLNQWVKTDSQTDKKYVYNNNYGTQQEIQFLAIDDLAQAGSAPLPNNYFKILWVEEPTTSKEQYGIDAEEKKKKYDGIKTWKLTVLRHLDNLSQATWETDKEFAKRKKTNFITEFYSFNPYQKNEPLLEKYHQYLKDDRDILAKQGFQIALNTTDKEVYMTSNYIINGHLNAESIKEIEKYKIDAPDYYDTVGLGMTGSTKDNTYSDTFPAIIEPYQKNGITWHNITNLWSFKNFRIGIDVGNGGAGEMSMVLIGKKEDDTWVPIREWDSSKWKLKHEWDPEKIAFEMIIVLASWEKSFTQMKKYSRTIVMDNDPNFQSVFVNAHTKYQNIRQPLSTHYETSLFLAKYQKDFKNEDRVPIWKYMFATRKFKIYKSLTPKLYEQYETHKMINGRYPPNMKKDDMRQALEIGMYGKISDVLRNVSWESITDEEIKNFLLKRQD